MGTGNCSSSPEEKVGSEWEEGFLEVRLLVTEKEPNGKGAPRRMGGEEPGSKGKELCEDRGAAGPEEPSPAEAFCPPGSRCPQLEHLPV